MEFISTSFDLSLYLIVAALVVFLIRLEATRQWYSNLRESRYNYYLGTTVFGEEVSTRTSADSELPKPSWDTLGEHYKMMQVIVPAIWPIVIPCLLTYYILKATVVFISNMFSKAFSVVDILGRAASKIDPNK